SALPALRPVWPVEGVEPSDDAMEIRREGVEPVDELVDGRRELGLHLLKPVIGSVMFRDLQLEGGLFVLQFLARIGTFFELGLDPPPQAEHTANEHGGKADGYPAVFSDHADVSCECGGGWKRGRVTSRERRRTSRCRGASCCIPR